VEVERAGAAVDRVDVVRRIERLAAGTFVEDRGRAELPGEGVEPGDVGPEAPKQQGSVRLVQLDDLAGIDVEDAAFARGFDQDLGTARLGQVNLRHGEALAIADAAGASYSQLMPLTLDDLFDSPDHYLHSFEGDAAVFMPMDRAAYHRSIFLDRRISPAADQVMKVPAGALADPARKPAPTGWIFHVAHCGSTLLARALDRPSANLVLREPLALRQLALVPDEERLALTAAMLSKRYRSDLPTIVKANVPVNFLLPALIGLDPDARAILLYATLRDYLLAILRSDNHRQWLRLVTSQLAAHLGDLSSLSDAELCASLWLAQMRAFTDAIDRMPNARALDAEDFFAEPGPVLRAAGEHLGTPMSESEIEATIEGPLFATYSKNPEQAFDNEARLARRAGLEGPLAREIEEAQSWVEAAGGGAATAALEARSLSA
jgi:hypothetical protein